MVPEEYSLGTRLVQAPIVHPVNRDPQTMPTSIPWSLLVFAVLKAGLLTRRHVLPVFMTVSRTSGSRR